MKLGSLCSGAGGLDLAVEEVFGAVTVWHAELDPAASKVLAARWPGVPNHGNIQTTDWASVEPVDILAAGYPCQPDSLAGKGLSQDDERWIWPDVADAVSVLRPGVVVLENVPGHFVRGFRSVLGSLTALGYDARWTLVRASDVGAPHRRERLFVVATDACDRAGNGERARKESGQGSATTSDAANVGHERAGAARDGRPRPADSGRGVTSDAASARRGEGQRDGRELAPDPAGDGRDERRPEPARLERGSDAAVSGATPPDADRDGLGGLKGLPTGRNALHRHGRGDVDRRGDGSTADADSDALREQPVAISRRGGEAVAGHAVQWGQYGPAIRRWERLTRPAPAPTELGAKGNQRLSPRFAEWMMGWPAGWVCAVPGISRNDQLKICGNGVVPQQATHALRLLANACEAVA